MSDAAVSWWGSLHDGYLERFASSRQDRTATFSVCVHHLAEDSETGRGSRFEIELDTVRAVNITAWESWAPLPAQDEAGWKRAVLQGRMISIEADDFAATGLRIADATVYETTARELVWPQITFTEPETALRLLTLDIDASESENFGDRGIAIVFDGIQIRREGSAISVDDFLALGEAYWRRFQEQAARQKV